MTPIIRNSCLDSRAFGPHHDAMKRISVTAAAILALPLLAACAPSDPPADGTSPAVTAAASATAEPTSEAQPAIDPSDDPFCALAADSKETADQITAQTEGMKELINNAISTGDVTAVNAWGAELAVLDEEMIVFLTEGRSYVEGDTVIGAWDTYTQFVQDYSLAVAQEAAVATDTGAFTTSMATIVSNPEIQSAVYFGPAAAGAVGDYITARCGIPS